MKLYVAFLFLTELLQCSNAGIFSKSKKVVIGPDWNNPQVTVAKYTNPKKPEYVNLPAKTTSISNNNMQHWTKTSDNIPNLDVESYCENQDETICALYEKGSGKLVGMQFGIEEPVMVLDPTPIRQNKKDKYVNPYRLEVIKAGFKWSTSQFNGGNNLLVLVVIFPNNPQLLQNLRPNQQLNPDKITVVGKQIRQISTKEQDLVIPNWYKQNCAKERGTHYGFGLSKDDLCHEYYPVIPLIKNKQLIGLLFMVPGKHNSRSNWFQKLDDDYTEKYFPKTSKCFQKSAPFSAVHVSFVDPKKITKCESSDNIKSGWLSKIRSALG